MVEFRFPQGAVYIFENAKAQRVKVGMTAIGVNDVADRLSDVNDMWLGRKVTCQICGRRTVNVEGYVPPHVGNIAGIRCTGGNALPLEKDLALATTHVENLKMLKRSDARIIKTLEKRIENYRHYKRAGKWEFRVAFYIYTEGFYTEGVARVERLSHKILAEHLDRLAPFGEVFSCSVSEATEAVETVLSQLGLLHSARKETQLRVRGGHSQMD